MKHWFFPGQLLFTAIFCIVIAWFAGCKSQENKTPKDSGGENANEEPLYPFKPFIDSELHCLDSMPLAILKVEKWNSKTIDSALLTADSVKFYAGLFTATDPNDKHLRPLYHEEAFLDMTLGYNTFLITASDKTLPLQSATVLLHPETNAVERLLLHTQDSARTIIRQLTWRKHKSLQVVEQFTNQSGPMPDVHVTNITWDQ